MSGCSPHTPNCFCFHISLAFFTLLFHPLTLFRPRYFDDSPSVADLLARSGRKWGQKNCLEKKILREVGRFRHRIRAENNIKFVSVRCPFRSEKVFEREDRRGKDGKSWESTRRAPIYYIFREKNGRVKDVSSYFLDGKKHKEKDAEFHGGKIDL